MFKLFKKKEEKAERPRVPHSWNEISINRYNEICDIYEENSLDSETERNMAVLAVLLDMDEDAVYDLPIEWVRDYMKDLNFLGDFKFDTKWRQSNITIKGQKYDVMVDANKMTTSQYIDYQTFWAEDDKRKIMAQLLSCFIIPHGAKYNDGSYDLEELRQIIADNISITLANSVCFFFLIKSTQSLLNSQVYGIRQMRKMMKTKSLTEEEKENLNLKIKEAESLLSTMVGLVYLKR